MRTSDLVTEAELDEFDRLLLLDRLWTARKPHPTLPLETVQRGREAAMVMICRRNPRIRDAIGRYNLVMEQ